MVFKVKTTLVLGAGASVGYGYPTGDGLIDCVIQQLSKEENQQDENARRLQRLLSFYDPQSIDSFLNHYKSERGLIDFAKTEIAYCLLKSENKEAFRRGHKFKGGVVSLV